MIGPRCIQRCSLVILFVSTTVNQRLKPPLLTFNYNHYQSSTAAITL